MKKAIFDLLQFLYFLATIFVVECDFDGRVGRFCWNLPMMSVLSTKEFVSFGDDVTAQRWFRICGYKIPMLGILTSTLSTNSLANLLIFFWKFIFFLKLMAEGLRRSIQDINLGCDDAPFVLPREVTRQAEEENRFTIIGRPVMPRRQNLRAIVASMPRTWGLEGIVRSRIIEGRRFQFVFPSEEAMETVLRRGPWAYADRMLVLQRWSPLMDLELLNFIPFWIQIRGIPYQFMNREMIVHIAREMGQYIQMEYNEELGGRLEFVRVRLNWNVTHPLKFQRNFQFIPGENTLLKFQYERLRGFCEACGMLSHDTGACIINNGGHGPDGGPDDGDEDNGNDNDDDEMVPNQGIIIEEIQEEEVQPDEDQEDDPVQAEHERNADEFLTENEDEALWRGVYRESQFSEGRRGSVEPDNGQGVSIHVSQKRKAWMQEAHENVAKFSTRETGETSGSNAGKIQRGQRESETEEGNEATQAVQRGAVGPEPPLPP